MKKLLTCLLLFVVMQLQAAITFTQLAAASADTSNVTSYAGTAGTPAAGELLIAFVFATATTGGTTDGGTMSGAWTWKQLTNVKFGTGVLTIFYAAATAATSTTPTYDCTGDAATGCFIYCLRVTGAEGVTVVSQRQIASLTTSTSTNPSVTLLGAALTGNGMCAMVVDGVNSST